MNNESNNNSYKHSELTSTIIKSFYKVYNKLGYGFLEKVYENSLMIELRKQALSAVKQQPIEVFYDDESVGNYFADIVVNDFVIIEIKTGEGLIEEHEAQLINYLRATNIEVGLLLNFGKSAEIRRKIFSNENKNH